MKGLTVNKICWPWCAGTDQEFATALGPDKALASGGLVSVKSRGAKEGEAMLYKKDGKKDKKHKRDGHSAGKSTKKHKK